MEANGLPRLVGGDAGPAGADGEPARHGAQIDATLDGQLGQNAGLASETGKPVFFFGYDGIHPSELGYAIQANEWIKALATAGIANLPLIDLSEFLGLDEAAGSTGVGASSVSGRTGAAVGSPAEFTPEAYEQLLRLYPAFDQR